MRSTKPLMIVLAAGALAAAPAPAGARAACSDELCGSLFGTLNTDISTVQAPVDPLIPGDPMRALRKDLLHKALEAENRYIPSDPVRLRDSLRRFGQLDHFISDHTKADNPHFLTPDSAARLHGDVQGIELALFGIGA